MPDRPGALEHRPGRDNARVSHLNRRGDVSNFNVLLTYSNGNGVSRVPSYSRRKKVVLESFSVWKSTNSEACCCCWSPSWKLLPSRILRVESIREYESTSRCYHTTGKIRGIHHQALATGQDSADSCRCLRWCCHYCTFPLQRKRGASARGNRCPICILLVRVCGAFTKPCSSTLLLPHPLIPRRLQVRLIPRNRDAHVSCRSCTFLQLGRLS